MKKKPATTSVSGPAAASPAASASAAPGHPGAALPGPRLTRRDLIRFEHTVRDALAAFFSFQGSSLYFPDAAKPLGPDMPGADGAPLHLARERRLLLPLVQEGAVLGVFVAKGVRLAAPKGTLAALPAAAALVLENLSLRKARDLDPLTGLASAHAFAEALAREIGAAQNCLLPSASGCVDPGLTASNGRLGVVLLDLDHYTALLQRLGQDAADTLLTAVAEAAREACPEQVLSARLADDRFAFLWPNASAKDCRTLAENLRRRIAKLDPENLPEPVALTASLGFSLFPQDLSGPQTVLRPRDMARVLAAKAQRAMATAKDQGRDRVFSFAKILEEGGRVLETLPLSRFSCNLGRDVDAQEGSRFLIWSSKFQGPAGFTAADGRRLAGEYPTMYKGEAVVIEVQDDMAFAEVLHLADASWPIEQGDRLTLLAADAPPPETAQSGAPQKDLVTGLYAYRDFLAFLASERAHAERFGLGLVRLVQAQGRRMPGSRKQVESLMKKLAALGAKILGEDATGGRYSLNSLCWFLPGRTDDELRAAFTELANAAAESLDATISCGVAPWPCLSFSRADALENARKALDHSLLLPAPQVALFDSVSLNISADRHFSLGDVYAAIEEYKLSLLADENNTLSRNSLAVCYARLGRLEQALPLFEQVHVQDPRDLSAIYNYATTCLRLGDPKNAEAAFKRCLKLEPTHVFSLVRLGQIAEQQGKRAKAKTSYAKAAALPGGEALASRHLARLALAAGKLDEARELLHAAITHNPRDAQSIHLMARIYLDQGQDPEIAVSLAGQAASLKPRKSYWDLYAQALSAAGRPADALRARRTAESL
ncbi:diguanylate cyclase and serine/threonine protein kinase with TPR repeat containing protein [Desulfovibrio sp. X2]|uniref:GGDEF domain-containing protein n=1 Tax=Desulfovibrio sp. X2 TaxID=941449 RepID=UPI00035877CE|nr:GGDEF domain-containing protein [Desulfovibrio sp. X2]EPR41772.1 diguanylate cyclase and serine/threonine protein kinase with TPR repeat containing protein [Desulfovibrio sp. X2]